MNLPKMPLVIQNIVSSLIKPLQPINVLWHKYEDENPKNASFIKTWGKRLSYLILAYFLLWLVFLRPIPSVSIIKELETRNATEIYSDDNILMGRYFIQAKDQSGCTSVKIITIKEIVSENLTLGTDNLSVCSGSTFNFDPKIKSDYTFSWVRDRFESVGLNTPSSGKNLKQGTLFSFFSKITDS
jgi:hypothetical protein